MSETRWRRTPCESSACVEIGATSYGDFLVRNSNFRADKVGFTAQEMRAFIRAVKDGHFDDLIWGPK